MGTRRGARRVVCATAVAALWGATSSEAWAKSCKVGLGGGEYVSLAEALKDGCDDIEILRDLSLEDPVTLGGGVVTIWASKPRVIPALAVPKGAELRLDGVDVVGRLVGAVGWDHGCEAAILAATKRYSSAPALLAHPSLCVTGGTVFLNSVTFTPTVVTGVSNAGIVIESGAVYGDTINLSGFSGMPAVLVGPNPASDTPILGLSNGMLSNNRDTAIVSDHGSVALENMTFTNNDSRLRGIAADVEMVGGTLTVAGGLFQNPGAADGTPASAFALDAAAALIDGATVTGYRASAGAAVRAKDWSSLWILNTTFDDLAAYSGGALYLEDPAGVAVETSTITRTNAVDGGVIRVSGGSSSSYVELLYDTVTTGYAGGTSTLVPDRGAVISADGEARIAIIGGAYFGDPALAPRVGGAVYVNGAGRFDANGVNFTGFTSVDAGGSFYLSNVEDASIAYAYVEDSFAGGLGGAVYASQVGWLAVEQSWFVGGRGYEGGHLALIDSNFDVVGSLFAYGGADQHGGSVYIAGSGSPQRLLADRFCLNVADVGGGAAYIGAGPTGSRPTVEISHSAFLRNADRVVDAVKVTSGSLAMDGNTFVGAGQTAGGDRLIAMYDSSLFFYNSLLLRADYGVHLVTSSGAYDEEFVGSWQVNHPVAVGTPARDRPDDDTHQAFDPLLRGDLGVGGEDCFFSVMPDQGSPAWGVGTVLDAGGPSGLGVYGNDLVRETWDLDFDGYFGFEDCDDGDPNVSYAGEGLIPHPSGLADADQDGAISEVCGGEDCDDTRADVGPLAYDAPGDGFDANCDGVDPELDGGCPDEDADGHGALPCGADCDDQAATVFPGATELELDGVDQDCDGADQTPWAVGGGGCVASGTDRGFGLAWIAALVVGARRRSRSVV